MKTFPLQVLKITEVVFEGDVVSLSAPGSGGEVTIMAKHETMLTSLRPGKLSLRLPDSTEQEIEIKHGFLEATRNKVTVLL